MPEQDRSALRLECESIHLRAIRELGADPDEFELEPQLLRYSKELATVPGISPSSLTETKTFFRALGKWAPSRYEILEFLPSYYYADHHIAGARQKSIDRDRDPLLPLKTAIITNPYMVLDARARDRSFDETCLILFGLGLWRYCDYLARVIARAIGSLYNFVKICNAEPEKALFMLYDALPRPAAIPVGDPRQVVFEPPRDWLTGAFDFDHSSKYHESLMFLRQMLITFLVGHEAGHFQLGHVGSAPPKVLDAYRRVLEKQDVARAYYGEFEADSVALLVLWDGMAFGEDFKLSLDFSSAGPFIYFSARAGFAYYVQGDANQAEIWQDRALCLLILLVVSMKKVGFAKETVMSVCRTSSIFTAAITCWQGASAREDMRSHVRATYEATLETAMGVFAASNSGS